MYTTEEFKDELRNRLKRNVLFSYDEDGWVNSICVVFTKEHDKPKNIDIKEHIKYIIDEEKNIIYMHVPISYGHWLTDLNDETEGTVDVIQKRILEIVDEHKEWSMDSFENKTKTGLKNYLINELNEIEGNYRRFEDKVKDAKREFINAVKRRDEYEIIYRSYNIDKKLKQLFAHLKDINENEYVKEVTFYDGIIRVTTKELPCYEDENDRYYLIPEALIDIDIAKGDVLFYPSNSGEGRKGWWNETYGVSDRLQVHPHVSYDGKACLGNASEQLADAFDEKEYYSVFLICLAFLQNVNIHDVAGQGVCRWDECDYNCNVIKEGHEPTREEYGDSLDIYSIDDMLETYHVVENKECAICRERHPVTEMYYCELCERYVCDEHWNFDHEMCEECYEENYVHDLVTGEEISLEDDMYYSDTDSNGITVYFAYDNEDAYMEYLKQNKPERFSEVYGDE